LLYPSDETSWFARPTLSEFRVENPRTREIWAEGSCRMSGSRKGVIVVVELLQGGDLPNFPDEPGVYVIVCAFGGNSSYRLGDVLYIGVSNSLRRRIAYATAAPGKSAPHSAQGPLLRFQTRGGV